MSEIIYRKLTDIKKLPNNPRTIKKDEYWETMDHFRQATKKVKRRLNV